MSVPRKPKRFAAALRLAKAGSPVFFSVGMAMVVAKAAALLAPPAWRPPAYAVIGATTAFGAWRLLTRAPDAASAAVRRVPAQDRSDMAATTCGACVPQKILYRGT